MSQEPSEAPSISNQPGRPGSPSRPSFLKRFWSGLLRLLDSRALLTVVAAVWTVGSFEQKFWSDTTIAQQNAVAEQQSHDLEQLKLIFVLVDQLKCADDDIVNRRQKVTRNLIAQKLPQYSSFVADHLDSCARTPIQKVEAKEYRDQANTFALVDNFFKTLTNARLRYSLGSRTANSLGLFEEAFSALPELYGDKVDLKALDNARKARDAKRFDEAASEYARAFQWFGDLTSGTNSPVGPALPQ